jgi:23S rRNA pseudouridine1911/1915/1917 synthase
VAWTVDEPGATLAAFVKAKAGVPWSLAKRHIAAGKVFVDGAPATAVDLRLAAGQSVELRTAAPRPRDPAREGTLVHDDPHVVVIDKPSGVSSVPYEDRESGTAMDLVRGAWRREGKPATSVALHVVHRIDRATSGLLMFAKTKRAELGLAAQLRAHSLARTYLCVAQRALRGATLCKIQLETGRTHQIRIHLAEAGHPLVGEPVYIRDYAGPFLSAPRLLLHAATLGFEHPITGAWIDLASALPPDFTAAVDRLAHG